VKVFRLRRSNVAEAAANQPSGLQNRARQVGKLGQSEASRRRSFKARRLLQNVVGRQRDEKAGSRMPVKVEQERFHGRVPSGYLSLSDSARRRPQTQVNMTSAAEVRHLDFVSP
jgi:hypothetical protein